VLGLVSCFLARERATVSGFARVDGYIPSLSNVTFLRFEDLSGPSSLDYGSWQLCTSGRTAKGLRSMAQGKRAARCCGSANRRGRRLTGILGRMFVLIRVGLDCNIETFLE